MQAVNEWFTSGLIIDAILAAVLIETVLLLWLGRRRRLSVLRWLPSLLAGTALLIVLRLVIAGAEWSLIASTLVLAGLAHLYDLSRRLQAER